MRKLNANQIYMYLAIAALVVFLILPQWTASVSAFGFSESESKIGLGGLFGALSDVSVLSIIGSWVGVLALGGGIYFAIQNKAAKTITDQMFYCACAACAGVLLATVSCFKSYGPVSLHPNWFGFVLDIVVIGALVYVPKFLMANEEKWNSLMDKIGQK